MGRVTPRVSEDVLMGKLRPFCEAALEEINKSQDHPSKHITFEQWVDQLDFGDRYWTKVKEELVRSTLAAQWLSETRNTGASSSRHPYEFQLEPSSPSSSSARHNLPGFSASTAARLSGSTSLRRTRSIRRMGRIRRDPSTGGLSSTEPRQPREVAGSSNPWQPLARTASSRGLGLSSSDDSDSEDEATLLTSREGVDLLAARRNYRSAQTHSSQARERWAELLQEGESLAVSQALENSMQAEDNVTLAREDVAIARDSLRLARDENQRIRRTLGEDGPSQLNLPRLGLPSFQEVVSTTAAGSSDNISDLISTAMLRRRGPRLPVLPTSTRALDQAYPTVTDSSRIHAESDLPLPTTQLGEDEDSDCPALGSIVQPDGYQATPRSPSLLEPTMIPNPGRILLDSDSDDDHLWARAGEILMQARTGTVGRMAREEGEQSDSASSAMRDGEQESWLNAAHTARERGRRNREDEDEEERARR